MKKIFLALIPLFFLATLFAQERYLEEITDSVSAETFTYIQKDGQKLDLDIYTPAFDDCKN